MRMRVKGNIRRRRRRRRRRGDRVTTVHQPKPMHYKDGSCVTVALPKLIHPFTCLVDGPTGSGKTSFLKKTTGTKNEKIYRCP